MSRLQPRRPRPALLRQLAFTALVAAVVLSVDSTPVDSPRAAAVSAAGATSQESFVFDLAGLSPLTFDVASDPAGRRIVVWSALTDGQPPRLYGRLFDPEGAPRSPIFEVDPEGVGAQVGGVVDSDGRGAFVVAWLTSEVAAGGNRRDIIHSRAFDPTARPLGPARRLAELGDVALGSLDVARALDGRTLVTWHRFGFDEAPIRGRFLDAQGSPTGPERALREPPDDPEELRLELFPRVAASAAGSFAVVWSDYGLTDLGRSVVTRLFDASGEPLGGAFGIAGRSGSYARVAPTVTAQEDDRFLVTWADLPDLPAAADLFSSPLTVDQGTVVAGPAVASGEVSESFDDDLPELGSDGFGQSWVLWCRGAEGLEESGLHERPLGSDGLSSGSARRLVPSCGQYRVAAAAAGPPLALWLDSAGLSGRVLERGPSCASGPTDLCLDDRFRVRAWWRDPRRDLFGSARAAAIGPQTGSFWFFGESNRELFLKVVDGRAVNGRFWFFWGGLTDLEVWLAVEDLESGRTAVYYNPPFDLPAQADTRTFAADSTAAAAAQPAPSGSAGALASPAVASPAVASATATSPVVSLGGRFELRLEYDDPRIGRGSGRGRPLSPETAAFSFFADDDLELLVKILDGRPVNGSFWVFRAALTDIAYTLTVQDTLTGTVRTYENASGSLRSAADLEAF